MVVVLEVFTNASVGQSLLSITPQEQVPWAKSGNRVVPSKSSEERGSVAFHRLVLMETSLFSSPLHENNVDCVEWPWEVLNCLRIFFYMCNSGGLHARHSYVIKLKIVRFVIDCNFFAHMGSALVSCLKSVDNHCVSFPWVRTFVLALIFFFFFWWPISK